MMIICERFKNELIKYDEKHIECVKILLFDASYTIRTECMK